MLFLHGYPSSSYDWRHLLELLPGRRTVCFDFLGFGLSEKPRDHVYSLLDQADLTEAVVARLGADEVVLVAHDMGTSVATELLARDVEGRLPFRLRSVVLLNGSMVIERASLTAAQKVLRSRFGPIAARLNNERSFRARVRSPLLARPPAHARGGSRPVGAARPLRRAPHHRQAHLLPARARDLRGALARCPARLGGPLELAWAMLDPIATGAVLDAVCELRPAAPVTRFEELGHYLQIEAPEQVAPVVRRYATGQPSSA